MLSFTILQSKSKKHKYGNNILININSNNSNIIILKHNITKSNKERNCNVICNVILIL